MIKAAHRLEEVLTKNFLKLKEISDKEASIKPSPNKWSKKELIGHLIDSASNNHQRFVRMQMFNELSLPQYEQDEWVALQYYQSEKWSDILNLWKAYNMHLIHVLKNMEENKLTNTARFPQYGSKTLQFIIDDYVDHIEHHLKHLFAL